MIRGSKNASKTTRFLNVDLDVYSRSSLQPLITALGRKVFVLYAGREKRTYSAHLELARDPRNADATIRSFCSLVKSLPRAQRALWNAARVRDFNIGVQAAMHPFSYRIELAADTVKAASEINSRIVFTIYAPEGGRRTPSRAN